MNTVTIQDSDQNIVSQKPTTKELWDKYHRNQNNENLEEQLVKEYIPLVKNIVGRLAMTLPDYINYEDLYSAGLVGLLQSIRNYDPSINNSFENYAKSRIRGAVLDELRKMDWIPRSVHLKAKKVQSAIIEVEKTKGSPPTEAEIAKALNISQEEYEALLNEIKPATFICLDAVVEGEDNDRLSPYESLADQSAEAPDAKAQKNELARLIAERIEQLPLIQRQVLAMYYFDDMRLREIAEAFGLTESRICQIHSQAILSIKAYLQKKGAIPEGK